MQMQINFLLLYTYYLLIFFNSIDFCRARQRDIY